MYHYFVGIDLGKAQDYTALAVIEEPLWLGSEVAWDAYNVFWPDSVDSFAGGWVSPSLLSPRYAHNALSVNYNYGRPAHPSRRRVSATLPRLVHADRARPPRLARSPLHRGSCCWPGRCRRSRKRSGASDPCADTMQLRGGPYRSSHAAGAHGRRRGWADVVRAQEGPTRAGGGSVVRIQASPTG